jgi:hypothetical protein
MTNDEIATYVGRYAPELDPDDVRQFMANHAKPAADPGTHVQWAVRILREQGEGEFGDGLSIDRVADELRRRTD